MSRIEEEETSALLIDFGVLYHLLCPFLAFARSWAPHKEIALCESVACKSFWAGNNRRSGLGRKQQEE